MQTATPKRIPCPDPDCTSGWYRPNAQFLCRTCNGKTTIEDTTPGAVMPETINLEPNYDALFDGFLRDAKIYSEDVMELPPEALHVVRNFLVPLNIAINAAASNEKLVEFRETLAEFASRLATKDDLNR